MSGYRIFRGNIVETRSNGKHIDPVLMNMARHHCETDDEIDQLIEFLGLRPIHHRQLDILLRHMGRRVPFLGTSVAIDAWEGDRLITCTMTMGNGLVWSRNRLIYQNGVIPETLRTTLRGRGLGELVLHPYLPTDLTLANMTQAKDHWSVNFDAKRRPRKAA